ncbi:MAG: MarR family winged helix-turn-helix transcriptional regulator [Gammaproteobacteria bacterium]
MKQKNNNKINSCLEVYSLAKKLVDIVRHEIELVLNSYNITFKQWQVLNAISLSKNNTPTSIAKYIGADKPSITRITDHLYACSLLKRERGIDDRRTIQLILTDDGYSALKIGQDALHDVPAKFKSRLTTLESKKFSKFESCFFDNIHE